MNDHIARIPSYKRHKEHVSTPIDCPRRSRIDDFPGSRLPVILEDLAGLPWDSTLEEELVSTPIDCSPISPSVNHWTEALPCQRSMNSGYNMTPPFGKFLVGTTRLTSLYECKVNLTTFTMYKCTRRALVRTIL